MDYKRILVCLSIVVMASNTYADLPLTVEDLTADKNRFKLETNLNYFNKSDTGYYQDNTNNIVKTDNNLDNIFASIGLKYGVTDRLELGTRISGYKNNQRTTNSLGQSITNTDSGLSGINLKSQYQLTNQHDTLPDSLIFADISAYNKNSWLEPAYASSVTVGGNIYKINDPIALSLNGSYQYNGERKTKTTNSAIDIGDVTSLSASMSFAVNPDISLLSGVGWQSRQANRAVATDTKIGHHKTKTNLNFGVAYAVSERNTLVANINKDISGNTGSVLGLKLTTKLGKLKPPLSDQYREKLE